MEKKSYSRTCREKRLNVQIPKSEFYKNSVNIANGINLDEYYSNSVQTNFAVNRQINKQIHTPFFLFQTDIESTKGNDQK